MAQMGPCLLEGKEKHTEDFYRTDMAQILSCLLEGTTFVLALRGPHGIDMAQILSCLLEGTTFVHEMRGATEVG